MVKLIFPNPFLKDYSCNNLIIQNNKKYLKLTPVNNQLEKYWISFAIEKGFEPIDVPEDYNIILKGTFNDSVYLKFDSNNSIQLAEKVKEYKIPITGNKIRSIILEGEIDQSIIIERLSIEHKDYIIPQTKKKILFISEPNYKEFGYLRKGEKNVLDYLEIVDNVSDDTIVYVRPVDELVTKDIFKRIQVQLNSIKLHSKAKIINNIDYLYNHKIKNFAFDIWTKNKIPCSEYQIVNNINDIYNFIDKYERCILRINNGWCGKNTFSVNKNSDIKSFYDSLVKYKNQIESNFNYTDIIISRKILPIKYKENLILNVGRCYVVNDTILNTHAFVHKMHNYDQLTGSIATFEDFIESHRKVQIIENNYKQLLIDSVRCLGIQVGCIDFLIEDDKPIILEVNAYWGMGLGNISYPYNDNLKKYLLDNYNTYKNSVNNIYERMDQYNLWRKFYELL